MERIRNAPWETFSRCYFNVSDTAFHTFTPLWVDCDNGCKKIQASGIAKWWCNFDFYLILPLKYFHKVYVLLMQPRKY
jgi:hypothetical protein